MSNKGIKDADMEAANKDILVIYHDKCLDGFGAAYAAWMKFGTTADYVAWSYERPATELPSMVGKDIYIVDFSFYPEQIEWMLKDANNITIIDHHKTFIDAVESNGYCDIEYDERTDLILSVTPWSGLDIHYDLERSGAVLAWQFFHDKPVPQLLLHIQDRDLWQFKLNGTKEICAALANTRIVERSWDEWDFLVDAFNKDDTEVTHSIYASGRAVIACQQELIDECIATASEPWIDEFGFKVITCNAPYSIASELGNRIASENPDCIAVILQRNELKGSVKYSLRSVGDVDCTALASKFGGGGHKNAAGFTTYDEMDSDDEHIE